MDYFVQLTETGQTVNLAHIASINWQEVPEEFEETDCTATITMSNGCFTCITPADAQILWEVLSKYNNRTASALTAFPQIVKIIEAIWGGR